MNNPYVKWMLGAASIWAFGLVLNYLVKQYVPAGVKTALPILPQ